MKKLLYLCLLVLFVSAIARAEAPDFMLGVDANYSLDMEAKGARWKWNGREEELFCRNAKTRRALVSRSPLDRRRKR
jgi:hypothetical protein